MTTNLTPTPVRIGSPQPIPADTEAANSSSLALFVQPILNAILYATNLAEIFTVGGNVTPTSDISWAQNIASGRKIEINQSRFNADGRVDLFGETNIKGYIRARKPTLSGTVDNSSPGSYSAAGQIVYWDGLLSMPPGVVWQISTIAPVIGDWIRFENFNPQSLTVKDPAGTTLRTLGGGAGTVSGETYVYNGTIWARVETVKQ